MTQEDKELLLKDLCARLPYGVKVQDELGRINKLVIGNSDLIRLYYDDFSIYPETCISLPLLRPKSIIADLISPKEFSMLFGHNLYDFYNANHIDYRGLIEKGLALEAPKDMYKLKEK